MGMMETTLTGAASTATSRRREFLTFRLGAEEFGVDIANVQEIRAYNPVTRIANAPAFIKGVVNLRGAVVPIVDLRAMLNLGDARYDAFTVVIVLNARGRVIGVVVDSVSDVLDLSSAEIKPASEFGRLLDAAHVTGLSTIKPGDQNGASRMMVLLDIEKLMGTAGIAVVDRSA